MREIKFRAYRIHKYSDADMDYSHNWVSLSEFFNHLEINYPDHILMQYTGIKDKNGREIYEGDIINNSVVYWSPQWAMFSIKGEGIGALIRFADDHEIQGHIYGNPELIK
jgi:uncharacterized phage protein (TIGR01671 family)